MRGACYQTYHALMSLFAVLAKLTEKKSPVGQATILTHIRATLFVAVPSGGGTSSRTSSGPELRAVRREDGHEPGGVPEGVRPKPDRQLPGGGGQDERGPLRAGEAALRVQRRPAQTVEDL